jgi:S-phase kinase-associated protein 1
MFFTYINIILYTFFFNKINSYNDNIYIKHFIHFFSNTTLLTCKYNKQKKKENMTDVCVADDSNNDNNAIVVQALKPIPLLCEDGETVYATREAACLMKTVESALEFMSGEDDAIPVPNIDSTQMRKVIEFCEHYVHVQKSKTGTNEIDEKQWEQNYIPTEHVELFTLTMKANFLDCKPLLEMLIKDIAEQIRCRTPEQIHQHFKIRTDMTDEEKEEVYKQNEWCQEFLK